MNVKGILIDSELQSVKRINVDNHITIRKTSELLNAKYIDTVEYKNCGLYFNECGVENYNTFFRFKDSEIKWYGGKALLIDIDYGEVSNLLSDCSLDISYLKNNIMWCQVDNEQSKLALKPNNIQVYTLTSDDLLDLFDDDFELGII